MSYYKLYQYDELYHHGVQGQKWGVRRWQNEDGSLTPEGKIRYNKSEDTKKFSKRLNDIDKQLANDRYKLKENRVKIFSKSTDEEKIQAQKNIREGEKEINKIIKEAEKAGYSVQSKEVTRAATYGKAIADDLLLSVAQTIGLQAFGIPIVILSSGNNNVVGKKYRVGEKE